MATKIKVSSLPSELQNLLEADRKKRGGMTEQERADELSSYLNKRKSAGTLPSGTLTNEEKMDYTKRDSDKARNRALTEMAATAEENELVRKKSDSVLSSPSMGKVQRGDGSQTTDLRPGETRRGNKPESSLLEKIQYVQARGADAFASANENLNILGEAIAAGINSGIESAKNRDTLGVVLSSAAKGAADSLDKSAEENVNERARQAIDSKYAHVVNSKGASVAADLVSSVNQMIPAAMLPGAAGTALLAATNFPESYVSARNNGADQKQAATYGAVNAAINSIGERLIGGIASKGTGLAGKAANAISRGASSRLAANAMNSIAKSPLAKTALSAVAKSAGEGAEEVVQSLLSTAAERATYNPEAKVDAKELAYEGLLGGLMGGAFQAASLPATYQAYRSDYDTVNNFSLAGEAVANESDVEIIRNVGESIVKGADEILSDKSADVDQKQRAQYIKSGVEAVMKKLDESSADIIMGNQQKYAALEKLISSDRSNVVENLAVLVRDVSGATSGNKDAINKTVDFVRGEIQNANNILATSSDPNVRQEAAVNLQNYKDVDRALRTFRKQINKALADLPTQSNAEMQTPAQTEPKAQMQTENVTETASAPETPKPRQTVTKSVLKGYGVDTEVPASKFPEYLLNQLQTGKITQEEADALDAEYEAKYPKKAAETKLNAATAAYQKGEISEEQYDAQYSQYETELKDIDSKMSSESFPVRLRPVYEEVVQPVSEAETQTERTADNNANAADTTSVNAEEGSAPVREDVADIAGDEAQTAEEVAERLAEEGYTFRDIRDQINAYRAENTAESNAAAARLEEADRILVKKNRANVQKVANAYAPILKRFGINGVVVEDMPVGRNAAFDRKTNTIHLSSRISDSGAVGRFIVHEFTHRGTKIDMSLADSIVSAMESRKGGRGYISEAVIRDAYADQLSGLSAEEADSIVREERAAHFMERIMEDVNVLDEFRDDRTFLRKILDAIRDFFARNNPDKQEQIRLRRIEDKINDLLKAANVDTPTRSIGSTDADSSSAEMADREETSDETIEDMRNHPDEFGAETEATSRNGGAGGRISQPSTNQLQKESVEDEEWGDKEWSEYLEKHLDELIEALDAKKASVETTDSSLAEMADQEEMSDEMIEDMRNHPDEFGAETEATSQSGGAGGRISQPSINQLQKEIVEDEEWEEFLEKHLDELIEELNTKKVPVSEVTAGQEGVVYSKSGEAVADSTTDGTIRLSLSTYEAEGRAVLRKYLDKSVSSGRLTAEEAREMQDSLEDIYRVCSEFKDKYAPFSAWSDAEVVRDTHGRPVFSVVTPNGEYKMNLDFSLVCKKRRTLDAVFNEMAQRGIIDEFELGQKSVVKINEIIRKHGFETACALCFVDAKRFRQASMADQFVSLYNELVESLVPEDQKGSIGYFNFSGNTSRGAVENGIDTWGNGELDFSHLDYVMKNYSKGTVEHKSAQYIKGHPEARKLLQRGDFMSSAGFDAVKSQNATIMKLYNSKKGTGGPKAAFGDVQYLSEVIKKAKGWTPAKAYAVGGVRVQSFSDYVPRMVFDYAQMIHDLAATGLPAHAYTKEVLFAKQFGLTGVKINMSLIPAVVDGGIAPGLDADGNYVWAGESFNYDEAVEIQNADGYTENCGTICVGVSKKHILKLLGDPNIRMVIPYHKSGLNPIVAHMNKIDSFVDYTGSQNTLDENGKKLSKDFDFNKVLREVGDPQKAVDRYLAWVDEHGYTAKFNEFRGHPNYYKLLEDFTLYDMDGNYVPQRAVKAVFPQDGDTFGSMRDLIESGLQEDAVIEGRRDAELGEIVDEIERTLPKTEAEIEETAVEQAEGDVERMADKRNNPDIRNSVSLEDYSDLQKSMAKSPNFKRWFGDWESDPENASKVVNDDGTPKVMYHGTNVDKEFTVFDTYRGRFGLFGIGSYFTDDRNVAESYTKKENGNNPRVYEVFLNIRNPLDMDAAFDYNKWIAAAGDDAHYLKDYFRDCKTNEDAFRALKEYCADEEMLRYEAEDYITDYILGMGYDGITHIGGGRYNKKDENRHRVYIAFEPEQIKSSDVLTFGDEGNALLWSDRFKNDRTDIRYSRDLDDDAYLKAVERGDTKTAQKMVDKAAKENGYTTKRIYHGTPKFGFTTFDTNNGRDSDGLIYATEKREVAANYGGRNNYAGVRNINKKLMDGNSLEAVIHNAESVFDQKYREITKADRENIYAEFVEIAEGLSEEIDSIYDNLSSLPGWESADYSDENSAPRLWDNICSLVWSINSDLDTNEDGTVPEYFYENIETDANRFEDSYSKFREYLQEHYDEIKNTPAQKVADLIYSHKLFDYWAGVQYRFLPAMSESNTVLTDGKNVVTKDDLELRVFNARDIGAYSLYGDPGENVLEVDAENHDWLSISCPEMGDGKLHSTDAIAKWAKNNGYTSVYFKNIYDGGIKSNEYAFFSPSQIKSADPVTYDDDGNVVPISERFNDDTPDIRYSRDLETPEQKHIRRLEEQNEYLKKQYQSQTAFGWAKTVSPAQRKQFAGTIAADIPGVSADEVSAAIKPVYDLFEKPKRGAKDTPEVRLAEARKLAQEAAERLVDGAIETEINPMYEQYNDLRNFLRTTPIKRTISAEEFGGAEAYSKWRDGNRGLLRVSTNPDARGIYSVYKEISAQYPEFFPEDITDMAEMLRRMGDVAVLLKAEAGNKTVKVNPLEDVRDSFVQDVANRILYGFDQLAKITPAAKYEYGGKVNERDVQRAYAEGMSSAAAREAQAYDSGLKEGRKQNDLEVQAAHQREDIQYQIFQRDFNQAVNNFNREIERQNKRIETLQKRIETRGQREQLAMAKKVVYGRLNRLNTMLTKPNRSKHIPQNLRAPVARLLEAVGTTYLPNGKTVQSGVMQDIQEKEYARFESESVRVVDEIAAIIGANKTSENNAVSQQYLDKLTENVLRLKEMHAEMNPNSPDDAVLPPDLMSTKKIEYVKQLNRILAMAENYIKDSNTVFLAGKATSAKDFSERMISDLRGKTVPNESNRLRKFFHDVGYEFVSADLFFEMVGESGNDIMRQYRKAQTTQAKCEEEYAQYIFGKTGGKYSTNKAGFNGDLIDISTNGKKLKVTRAQLMQLYMTWKRPAGRRHLRTGGAIFVNEAGVELKENTILINNATYDELISHLSDEDKRIADALGSFMVRRCAEWGNDASMQMYGYRMFEDPHYFPMDVSNNVLPANWDSMDEFYRLENAGMTKSIKENASAPLRMTDIFDVADFHVRTMAAYAAYAPVSNDMQRILNMPGVNEAVNVGMGKKGAKYLETLVKTIASNKVRTGDMSDAARPLQFFMNAYKRQAVSFNISTALKQPLSIVRALNDIDAKYILKVPASMMGKEYARAYNAMIENSGVAKMKMLGYSDTGFGKSLRQIYDTGYINESGIIRGSAAGTKAGRIAVKTYDKITDAGMWAAGKMDEATWVRLWRACELEVSDRHKGLSAKEKTAKVAERFNEIIGRSQVVDTVLDTSPLMRNNAMAILTPFMNEPTKALATIITAADAYRDGKSGSKKKLVKAIGLVALNNLLLEPIVSALMTMWRDEEDDTENIADFSKKFLKLYAGVDLDGDTSVASVMTSNAVSGVFGFPILQIFYNTFSDSMQNYSNEKIDTAALSNLIRDTKNLIVNSRKEAVDRVETNYKLFSDFLGSAAAAIGIPLPTLRRQASAMVRTALEHTDSYDLQWRYAKILYNLENSSARTQKQFYNILAAAYKANDVADYQYMLNDLKNTQTGKNTIGISWNKMKKYIEDRGGKYEIGSDLWLVGVQAEFNLSSFNPAMKVESMLGKIYKSAISEGVKNPERALPSTPALYSYNKVDENGNDVLDENGDPVKVEMTLAEYEDFIADVGKLSYNILLALQGQGQFKNLSAEEQVYCLDKAYDFAARYYRSKFNPGYDLSSGGKWMAEVAKGNLDTTKISRAILNAERNRK